ARTLRGTEAESVPMRLSRSTAVQRLQSLARPSIINQCSRSGYEQQPSHRTDANLVLSTGSKIPRGVALSEHSVVKVWTGRNSVSNLKFPATIKNRGLKHARSSAIRGRKKKD